MSCISSNFSSFFLNSLNDPSEFSKYLSNGELKCSNFEDFQVFSGCGAGATSQQQQQQQQQYSQNQLQLVNGNTACGGGSSSGGDGSVYDASNSNNYMPHAGTQQHTTAPHYNINAGGQQQQQQTPAANFGHQQQTTTTTPSNRWPTAIATPNGAAPTSAQQQHQHFDGSFEFIKYLRHSSDFTPNSAAVNVTTESNNSSSSGGSNAVDNVRAHTPSGNAPTHNTLSNHSPASPNAIGSNNNSNNSAANGPTTATASSSASSSSAAAASLLDLDTSTSQKSRSASRKVAALLSSVSRASNSLSLDSTTLDVFDHDSKQTIFDLQHLTNGSNSNESSLELSTLAFPNSQLNASNSNTSSEGAAGGIAEFGQLAGGNSGAPKPLTTFVIKENFDVHPSHKVEEGIFQHMNKLPSKKKDTLKQLGVRFTGQMTLIDKSIVVDNFVRFCEEYDIKDHRPFLSLNQCGLNKPEQIKFARYLGQGLPTFTLFCIYSNFKNLFCTKRTEIYTKDGYNLPYILDKTKRFLANTTADLKNMAASDGLEFALQQTSSSSNSSSSNSNNNNNNHNVTNNNNSNYNHVTHAQAPPPPLLPITTSSMSLPTAAAASTHIAPLEAAKYCPLMPRTLENLVIYENFDVHETHRIEDGVCTHITRLPPKKQELLKQFGIQSSSQQSLSYYEKYIIVENFNKFCNEYQISDHRPFLDFHESGLPKCEQLKFVRYLGQGIPNLTLNKIYVGFKDLLGMSRLDKVTLEGYSLETLLKKKRKNLYNRLQAAGDL